MGRLRLVLIFVTVLGLLGFSESQAQNLVTYLGGLGQQALHDVHALSDGSFLLAGSSTNLDWLPAQTKRVELSFTDLEPSTGSDHFAVMLHVAPDLQTIRTAYYLPKGAAENFFQVRGTNVPGAPTETLYVSGLFRGDGARASGYFIAQLTGNGVDAPLAGAEYVYHVWAEGQVAERQPWDVNAQGEVTFVTGQAHADNWAAVYQLNAAGQRMVVPGWRSHWRAGGEWYGDAAAYPSGESPLLHSGIVLKDSRCDLRSWTDAAYTNVHADGNGGTKQGDWPLDVLYAGPCVTGSVSTAGPGYTGYAKGTSPVFHGSALAIDRKTGWMYLGLNAKSKLPDGNPDFEPAVVAYDDQGYMQWWSRLYHEVTPAGEQRRSTPDQYVDGLTLDYSALTPHPALVVTARCHGNNVENFWEGNTIAGAPEANGFQNRFTGTSGNIHLSWLGKLDAKTGSLHASSYVAEYAESGDGVGGSLPDARFGSWPNPNAGWPKLNTTRLRPNRTVATADGSVLILGTGRRTLTTTDAYQEMPLPQNNEVGSWNEFVRVYNSDLSSVDYSSLVTGAWDRTTGAGGGNTVLTAAVKTATGLLAVGYHQAAAGDALGVPLTTALVPGYGTATPVDQTAFLARLESDRLVNPADGYAGVSPTEAATPSNRLRAWPNPTTGVVHVAAAPGFAGGLVHNPQGRVVARLLESQPHLDLSALPAGLYTLVMFRTGGTQDYVKILRE